MLLAGVNDPDRFIFAYNRMDQVSQVVAGQQRKLVLNGFAGPATRTDARMVDAARRRFLSDLSRALDARSDRRNGGQPVPRFRREQVIPFDAVSGWNSGPLGEALKAAVARNTNGSLATADELLRRLGPELAGLVTQDVDQRLWRATADAIVAGARDTAAEWAVKEPARTIRPSAETAARPVRGSLPRSRRRLPAGLCMRADDGNRTRMASLEGFGCGSAEQRRCRSGDVSRCPSATVNRRGLPPRSGTRRARRRC